MDVKRVFLIVMDSFGIGELPDADKFGDCGSNTLISISSSKKFHTPNLAKLGLFNIPGNGCDASVKSPIGVYGKAAEQSKGKDTVTGHWEIGGLISKREMPTYPNGFPIDLLNEIEKATGIGWLCNKPYSGTDVIRDYGKKQKETGKMIVYTSADSVYQAAAHNDVIPLSELYKYCETARKLLSGGNAVGRVIARPFVGEYPNYIRTSDRHDYALEPFDKTILDYLKSSGFSTITVGKISDIFAGCGVSERIPTTSNTDGMKKTDEVFDRDFRGLCFVNLVDFDSAYGHRNDVDGYAAAVSEFDEWLGRFIAKLNDDDLLIVTADHGCDPSTPSTDHSREYIPILCYANGITPENIGVRDTFADIGKTILDIFTVSNSISGTSFAQQLNIDKNSDLLKIAFEARKMSYSPYSHFKVGAALECCDGTIYTGCNIENASFSPTICAERTAFVKAISEGKRQFRAIAVAGEKGTPCFPCGVCRQFMSEFVSADFKIILSNGNGTDIYDFSDIYPFAFGKDMLN